MPWPLPNSRLTTNEKKRHAQLETHPELFNQVRGCCGFAAVIMSMIRKSTGPDTLIFQALQTLVFHGHCFEPFWPPIPKYANIPGRILKRSVFAGGKWEGNNVNTGLDVKLCVGLAIALKEWLKYYKKDVIWNEAKDFSSAFGWEYSHLGSGSGKLKTFPTADFTAFTDPSKELSYKQGDFGLPRPALEALISMVYPKAKYTVQEVVSNSVFKTQGWAKKTWKEKTDQLRVALLALNNNLTLDNARSKGIIVGWSQDDEPKQNTEKYDYLRHWTYMPPQKLLTDGQQMLQWTWGAGKILKDWPTSGGWFFNSAAPRMAIHIYNP